MLENANMLSDLWDDVLAKLQGELSKPGFDTWLRGTRPLDFDGQCLIVGVRNSFAQQWIQTHYLERLRAALGQTIGHDTDLRLIIDPAADQVAAAIDQAPAEAFAASNPAPASPGQRRQDRLLPLTYDPRSITRGNGLSLNPKYTFDSFVVGDSNRLAHAASQAVAEAPARAYNPLFIYGGAGLGKTHLMQAIGHRVNQLYPQLIVVYVSSETFTNELINAIRDDRTIDFKNRYRSIDILLIDDIQFLAGKERTQEEFFHTFEALHGANRQLVISSDRPPKDIPTLEDRLRTRFEWGLLADIATPDLETRVAILRKKAQREALQVPDDVIMHIATHVTSNIRELEGSLVSIVARFSLEDRPIDLSSAAQALKDLLPTRKSRQTSMADVQRRVAERYSLTVDDLKSDSRVRRMAFPRQIAMYLCRELTGSSLPRIGEEFGGRDHTTVLHACDKIGTERRKNPELDESLRSLVHELQGLPS